MDIKRGDIIYIDLGQHVNSSVQSGRRPCIVISCNACNTHSPTITVCPLSTKINKKFKKTHVDITKDDVDGYLHKKSVILAEQVCTVDRKDLLHTIGHVKSTSQIMEQLNKALYIHFGFINDQKCHELEADISA